MKKSMLIHPDELTTKWIDRMSDNGVQILALHPPGGIDADNNLVKLLEMLEDPAYRELLDYAAEKGLEIEYELHAVRYLLPREMFDAHPDYYRTGPDGCREQNWNFCLSNPAAMEYVADRAVELMGKLYRSTDHYYFWMDDAKNSKCFCENCRQYSASDQQLLVMNHIVTKMRKVNPQATLSYLAYFDSITPPDRVKPAEGIILEYAPYERDMKKDVSSMPPEEIQNIKDLLSFFGRKGSRVLEYWYDNSLFSGYRKPPALLTVDAEMVQRDIRFYLDLGFEDVAVFACYLGPDYEELHGEVDISAFRA